MGRLNQLGGNNLNTLKLRNIEVLINELLFKQVMRHILTLTSSRQCRYLRPVLIAMKQSTFSRKRQREIVSKLPTKLMLNVLPSQRADKSALTTCFSYQYYHKVKSNTITNLTCWPTSKTNREIEKCDLMRFFWLYCCTNTKNDSKEVIFFLNIAIQAKVRIT